MEVISLEVLYDCQLMQYIPVILMVVEVSANVGYITGGVAGLPTDAIYSNYIDGSGGVSQCRLYHWKCCMTVSWCNIFQSYW